MNKQEVCIATLTWARDEEEESTLRRSLQALAALDIPVFITDGGSGTSFLDFVRNFPHFVLSDGTTRGVWPQAKNSLFHAYHQGASFIFYTEPDKLQFFEEGLGPMLDQVTANEQTGVVMASRSAAGFASFPAFQQMTETTINNCCTEILGQPVDYTYGPFLLNRKLVPYLMEMPEDTGWGWRPYLFNMAQRLGYTVAAFTGDFFCPENQREDNRKERLYRMRQLSQNLQGLMLSANVSLSKEQ
jgi:hypothetical protein